LIALPNPRAEVQEYIDGVLSGTIVAGKLVRLAVERHVHDLKHGHERGLKFDYDKATRAVLFFPAVCRHSIGEWDDEPFELSNWQAFIVWCLFGWINISEGTRRFRRAYLSVARKNGKTTWAAALGLLLLFFDNEPGAEIYCCATKEKQARILHKEAVRMVKASPSMKVRRADCWRAPPSISWEQENSFFQPLGSDSDTTDGLNPHGVIEDELHAWRERHRGLKEKLATGGNARRQPLEIMITTAGDDHSEIWKEEDGDAVRTLESVICGNIVDDSLFAFVARIDPEDDPFDEAVWPKANPNYAISVKPERMREMANQARQNPAKMNQFLRYHCNVQVSSTERAISADVWAKGNEPLSIVDGAYGYGGLDLGRSNDWCAIGACFPILATNEEGEQYIERWEIKSKAWTCRDGDFPVDHEPYRSWIKNGLLEACDGDQVDFAEVRREIAAWSDQYQIVNWAFDPSFATSDAQLIQTECGLEIYKFFQTARMYNEPIRRFLSALEAGKIRHGNDPVLGWQAGNLTIIKSKRSDEWMPEKGQKLYKIDGMIAVLMAFAGTLAAVRAGSYYDKNELELG
jgi:phage terminase large subunit-like protein